MWESLLIVAGAFGATLLAIYINNVVFKPVLLINETSLEKIFDYRINTWFFKLVIKNVGLRRASNCMAMMSIKGITKEDVYEMTAQDGTKRAGGTLLRANHFPQEELQDLSYEAIPWDMGLIKTWEGRETYNIDINTQAQARLLLLSIDSDIVKGGYPVLFIEPSPRAWNRIALIAHRRYEGEIILTAGNANPRNISFTIEQDENKEVTLKILKVSPETKCKVLRQLWFGQ